MAESEERLGRRVPAEVRVPAGEVRLVESHHAEGFAMESGSWPFHKFCWVAFGKGSLEFANGISPLRRDDFLFLPAGWAHRFVDRPGSPLTLVLVCLSPGFLADTGNGEGAVLWQRALSAAAPGEVLRARTGFHHTALVERIRRALREQDARREGWRTGVMAEVSALLVRLSRGHLEPSRGHEADSRRAVAGAVEFVDAHPREPLQIADMAERCQLSPRRFTDLFRRQTGETFNAYLVRKRVELAKDRLRETGHILYACHESGFNDPAYFYRVFKRQTGLTPGEFVRGSKTAAS